MSRAVELTFEDPPEERVTELLEPGELAEPYEAPVDVPDLAAQFDVGPPAIDAVVEPEREPCATCDGAGQLPRAPSDTPSGRRLTCERGHFCRQCADESAWRERNPPPPMVLCTTCYGLSHPHLLTPRDREELAEYHARVENSYQPGARPFNNSKWFAEHGEIITRGSGKGGE